MRWCGGVVDNHPEDVQTEQHGQDEPDLPLHRQPPPSFSRPLFDTAGGGEDPLLREQRTAHWSERQRQTAGDSAARAGGSSFGGGDGKPGCAHELVLHTEAPERHPAQRPRGFRRGGHAHPLLPLRLLRRHPVRVQQVSVARARVATFSWRHAGSAFSYCSRTVCLTGSAPAPLRTFAACPPSLFCTGCLAPPLSPTTARRSSPVQTRNISRPAPILSPIGLCRLSLVSACRCARGDCSSLDYAAYAWRCVAAFTIPSFGIVWSLLIRILTPAGNWCLASLQSWLAVSFQHRPLHNDSWGTRSSGRHRCTARAPRAAGCWRLPCNLRAWPSP